MKQVFNRAVFSCEKINSEEMINKAIEFIETQERCIVAGMWTGHRRKNRWDSMIVYINPEIVKKYEKLIFKEFGVMLMS